jgi:hypothetical protein
MPPQMPVGRHRARCDCLLPILRAGLGLGKLGQRVDSRLAGKRLTPRAKAANAALLEPGESLADASLRADENRGKLPKTAPWHYVCALLDEVLRAEGIVDVSEAC